MYRLFRPLLFLLDPERGHRWALSAAGRAEGSPGLAAMLYKTQSERLEQTVLGKAFPNPVGLAAGYDKSAQRLRAWPALGFGFAEIGSVTARGGEGNPRPRLFRLPDDQALINRMGLNNVGAEIVAQRLADLPSDQRATPIGVNVAKTHDPKIVGDDALDDFQHTLELVAPHADYLALNVSCPNTTEGKTFEEPKSLDSLLRRVAASLASAEPRPPVLVKLSPPGIAPGGVMDLGWLDALIAVSAEHKVDGFILTNTAPDRVNLATDPVRLSKIGSGGLSGRPIAERALKATRRVFEITDGKVPIIGVGGIDSAERAYERIRAGATLLQIYTGLVYRGPGLPKAICQGLIRLLDRDGLDSVADAVGADV